MALAGVELETFVSEPDALTFQPNCFRLRLGKYKLKLLNVTKQRKIIFVAQF